MDENISEERKNLTIGRLRHQIRELEELNKMLQKNMFHYEYRARDEGVENIELRCEVDRLRKQLADKKQEAGEDE